MLVGFSKATIAVFDETGQKVSEYVIEGKQNEGATSTANITGLSSEAVRVPGSDTIYYISQEGTGDVVANLGLLDLLESVNDEILGYKKTESKISLIGRSTKPPFCSLLLESKDLRGDTALLGFFKGKFAKDAIDLATLDPSTPYTPEAEAIVFNAINDDKEGVSKGEVVGKYVGKDEDAITELRTLVLGATLPPEG